VLDTPCSYLTLDDNGTDSLKDHFEIQDLTLGRLLNSNFHISFDWPDFGPFPSHFRDVRFHLDHSDHFRWFMHSYSHIFIKPLTCASDFTYTHLSSDWITSFDKLKRALSCIELMHLIWVAIPVSYYLYFYKDCVRSFDKLLRALVGFNLSSYL